VCLRFSTLLDLRPPHRTIVNEPLRQQVNSLSCRRLSQDMLSAAMSDSTYTVFAALKRFSLGPLRTRSRSYARRTVS
jgi:hypothetical protein